MNATQWAEFAGLGFAMSVLSWVIWRLTWTIVRLVHPTDDTKGNDDGESDPRA